MKNMFFYTRKIEKSVQVEGQEKQYDEFIDSFNINLVIRTIQISNNEILVLLNDLHERAENIPDFNPKTGKSVGLKRVRNTFQSEIRIFDKDCERFRKFTEIQ